MARDEVLVNTDWAARHLDAPGVVFAEVDEDTTAYDSGHIRGAVKMDWKRDLQDPVRRDIISQEGFSELLSRLGIANDDTVILYGGNNNWFAAWALWCFEIYGHRDVRLLDGGRKKWDLEGRPWTTDTPHRPRTDYRAPAPDLSIRAFRDQVVQAVGVQNLVDVRSPAEYSGRLLAPAHLQNEAAQQPGHVPTAINVPWSTGANEDGTFKSDEELAQLYRDAGLDNDKDTIVYCRIGERSSFSYFVLAKLLGRKNVRNYDGSFSEYGSLIGVPIENSDRPGKA
ncbi:sulfurtransferase [Micromonospora sp. NPDC048898]|uniref:sulfurtransferase n=1 Tax=Micromonospora sp. NPDC048898 TaxID=3364260 RepID=UPI00371E95EA